MYLVEQLLAQHGSVLGLILKGGKDGLKRPIKAPEVQRPGIGLAGRLAPDSEERILVLGASELSYLSTLKRGVAKERLRALLTPNTPAAIIARNLPIPTYVHTLCEIRSIPLFTTPMLAMDLVGRLTFFLYEALSESVTLHGTLIEIFGFGMLIRGDSSIGKSEAALSLVERGHRLIADDVVTISLTEGEILEGMGPEITRHVIEIRGIGILNIAQLYGSVHVRETKKIDMVVHLEEWSPKHVYDRIGLHEKMCVIHGRLIPHYTLPVKSSHDMALLIETVARMHSVRFRGHYDVQKSKHPINRCAVE